MSDLISRQAVLDIARGSKSNWIDNSILFKKVNDLPSADSRNMEEIKEIIKCDDADAETKLKMILNVLNSKPHYFQPSAEDCKGSE